MGNALNLLLILCGVFSMASIMTSLWTDCWQINSKGSVMLSIRCKGLWKECVWDRYRQNPFWEDCEITCGAACLILLPAIILTRASIITASIMSALALLSLIIGFKNFNFCQDVSTKLRCLRLSSVLYFLVGMSSSAGIIRYCVYVYYVHQYEVSLKIPGFPSFEYGYSFWMAVGGSLGAITTAIMTCYLCLHKKKTYKIKTKAIQGSGCSEGLDVITTYV